MSAAEPQPFARAWPWLAFIASIFFFNFFSRVIFSPFMPVIEEDLGLTHAQAGQLFLGVSVGYAVTVLLAGLVNSRVSHRRCVAVASMLTGASLMCLAGETDYWETMAALVGLGVCGGLYLPSGIAAIQSLAHPENYGKAMAVHEMAPNLGLLLAPLVAEALLSVAHWRQALAGIGALSTLLGLAFWLWGKGGERRAHSPSMGNVTRILKTRAFWIMALLFSLAIGASFGPYAVLPLFLRFEHGMDAAHANRLMALSRISGPVMVVLAGWATDRLGSRLTIASSFLLVGLGSIAMGLASGAALTVAIFAQPVATVLFFPAGFAELSRAFPEDASLSVSLAVPAAVILGTGVTPAFLGWFGDAGSFGAGFLWLGAFVLGALLLLPGLPAVGPKPTGPAVRP